MKLKTNKQHASKQTKQAKKTGFSIYFQAKIENRYINLSLSLYSIV
jgi:hypothetical protein